ncbi:S8 family serine peptidase [Bacillus sp. JJ1533]|uniref:S8 family serine peptidase n=1 Tax=Bacillus sp. JJ1533 TaxID=3122959 RepID=UPI00300041A4
MVKRYVIGGIIVTAAMLFLLMVLKEEPITDQQALKIAEENHQVKRWLEQQTTPYPKIASTELPKNSDIKKSVTKSTGDWVVTFHSSTGQNPMVLTMSIDEKRGEVTSVTEEDRVIVLFKENVDQEIIEESNGTVLEVADELPIASATIPTEEVDHLKDHPEIEVVEDDQLLTIHQQTQDWGIKKVKTASAWSSNLTGKGIKIAAIDTGIDIDHQDLKISGGASFVDYTNSYDDDNGHGTHVAGIIGAKNNSVGTVGIAYDSSIYAVKVLDNEGLGYLSSIIQGIDWAITNQMDIINLSIGAEKPSEVLEMAVNKAYQNNILVVASAGNLGEIPQTNTIEYPAKYDSAIAVGAVDENLKHASFSSTGKELEVAAPGEDIKSTYKDNSYAIISGTSMAAPYVSGNLALLKQANPTANAKELRNILQKNVEDLGEFGRDQRYGYGFIQSSASDSTHGLNRYETSVMISKRGWPTNARTVILARGDAPTDALTGSVLAVKHNAPILLTRPNTLPKIVLDEVKRLRPSNVLILGGEMAVSKGIETQLRGIGYKVKRIFGDNRYETASLLSKEVGESEEIFIATGGNSPDALSIASYAGMIQAPILLTGKGALRQETIDFLRQHAINKVTIIGGPDVISTQVVHELRRLGIPKMERISGMNRYATSATIIHTYMKSFTGPMYVSSGVSFVDALPGAALAAKTSSPIVLVHPRSIPKEIEEIIKTYDQSNPLALRFLGGYSIIEIETRAKMEKVLIH